MVCQQGTGWRRTKAVAALVTLILVAGCQTISETANGVAMVAFVWTGILLLLPAFIVAAPPALIFEGLDSQRAGVVQAEFSPDGETIVFAYRGGSRQRLYRVPVAGGEPVPIRPRDSFDLDCAFSPDGSRIAFVSSTRRQRSSDIFTLRSDGSGIQQHTNDDALELGPRFSPDGDRLVFSRWHLGDRGRKFVRASIVEIALDTGVEIEISTGDNFDLATWPQLANERAFFSAKVREKW